MSFNHNNFVFLHSFLTTNKKDYKRLVTNKRRNISHLQTKTTTQYFSPTTTQYFSPTTCRFPSLVFARAVLICCNWNFRFFMFVTLHISWFILVSFLQQKDWAAVYIHDTYNKLASLEATLVRNYEWPNTQRCRV